MDVVTLDAIHHPASDGAACERRHIESHLHRASGSEPTVSVVTLAAICHRAIAPMHRFSMRITHRPSSPRGSMLARVPFTGGSGRWALGWSHFRFGGDLLGGDIDSLHTVLGEFEVDSRGNANQHSSASPRSIDHSLDAFQFADVAANAPTDTDVHHRRVGIYGIYDRIRRAILPRFCHAVLQAPQQKPPSDEFREPTEAGDLLDISIARWNKTLWSERACLHFS